MSKEAISPTHIQFRRIGWRQTLEVARLSRSLLPEELCRKTHTIFGLFFNLERKNRNLSFGLYTEGRMVGYMLVYFHDHSLFLDEKQTIAHIDEYCVEEGYRSKGREVLAEMLRQIDLWHPKCPIEALATGEALDHWLSIGRIVSRMGYETEINEHDCDRASYSMGRIRWSFNADKKWQPNDAMKLPLGIPFAGLSTPEVCKTDVLHIKSSRQWLSLRTEYEEMAKLLGCEGSSSDFEYQWQWWRHFGIDSELCVIAVREAEVVVAFMPLRVVCLSDGSRAIALIGDDDGYPAAGLIALDRKKSVQTIADFLRSESSTICFNNALPNIDVIPHTLPCSATGPILEIPGINTQTKQLHLHFIESLS